MKVFTFRIYHINEEHEIIDHYEHQERYVLAETEAGAEKKLDKYRKEMISKGFADFICVGNPIVELDGVIN